jgi:hypothetical protein
MPVETCISPHDMHSSTYGLVKAMRAHHSSVGQHGVQKVPDRCVDAHAECQNVDNSVREQPID